MHFTYILNIDIDITIFCKYRINIVSKLKSDIEASLFSTVYMSIAVAINVWQLGHALLLSTVCDIVNPHLKQETHQEMR